MLKEQLKEQRTKLGVAWEAYKTHRDSVNEDPEKRTAEENEKFDRLDKDVNDIEARIEKTEGLIERADKDKARELRYEADLSADVRKPDTDGTTGADAEEKRMFSAYDAYLKGGLRAVSLEDRELFDKRAIQAGADVDGGYLITPQKMLKNFLKDVDDVVKVRGLATIHTLKKAGSLGVPTLDTDLDDWEWTTELATGSDDDAIKFGKREMRPHPIAKRVKISDTLIRMASTSPQKIVNDRMRYKFGSTMENAYMTGNGHNKPLGMFVDSSDGISSTRDFSTDNTATLIKADNLIGVQGNQKEQYRSKSKWLFHRDAITQIRKLKDGNGQYLWSPGLANGQPSMILGDQYITSEFVPNTFTTGLYVGMYGDYKYYWILDVLSMTIKVLRELYAETNQIGYIGRYEGDGAPVLEEAFTRVTLG